MCNCCKTVAQQLCNFLLCCLVDVQLLALWSASRYSREASATRMTVYQKSTRPPHSTTSMDTRLVQLGPPLLCSSSPASLCWSTRGKKKVVKRTSRSCWVAYRLLTQACVRLLARRNVSLESFVDRGVVFAAAVMKSVTVRKCLRVNVFCEYLFMPIYTMKLA